MMQGGPEHSNTLYFLNILRLVDHDHIFRQENNKIALFTAEIDIFVICLLQTHRVQVSVGTIIGDRCGLGGITIRGSGTSAFYMFRILNCFVICCSIVKKCFPPIQSLVFELKTTYSVFCTSIVLLKS